MQVDVCWCCATGKPNDRDVECELTDGVAQLKVSSTRSDQVVLEGSQSNTSCWKSFTYTSPDSDIKMTICTDSDAARGMVHRVGCGRVRHLQTRYLWHQQALCEGQFNVVRCGTKENLSDLGTKVLERESMASCMSKLAIVPASTVRGAIVAALARVTSASDEVMADGCCSRRVGNTTAGVMNRTDSVSTFVASVGAGGAVVVMMLVGRAAMSKYSGWNRQTRSNAEAQSSA